MAAAVGDISFTDTNVVGSSSAKALTGITAEAIGIGQLIVPNRADSNKLYLANANDLVNTYRNSVAGITLAKATAAGQTIVYQNSGIVTFGSSVLEKGMLYVSSATNGGICPASDYDIALVKTSQITTNVITLTMAMPHAFKTGQSIVVAGVGAPYDGTWTILAATPGATTLTITLTHANDGPNTVTGSAQLKTATINLVGIAKTDSQLQLMLSNTGITRA